MSWLRPPKRCARVSLPFSPSNTYSFLTHSQGSSRRSRLSSSRRRPRTICWSVMAPSIALSSVPSASARARALVGVLVVSPPPAARLVASLGGAVEPLVHAPEAVQSARIGGIGVVDGAVLERERAHAGPIALVSGGARSTKD